MLKMAMMTLKKEEEEEGDNGRHELNSYLQLSTNTTPNMYIFKKISSRNQTLRSLMLFSRKSLRTTGGMRGQPTVCLAHTHKNVRLLRPRKKSF
jgi:hypothetical protein